VDDCVFCEIVAGRALASVVHEDALSMAFLDTRPVTPGHLLVVPKRHASDLAALDAEVGAHLFRVALGTARALRAAELRCEGINLFLADDEAAGQEVFHVHLHVFPRFAGDGFRIEANGSSTPSRAELDATAASIRDAYRLAGSGTGDSIVAQHGVRGAK
jgi:diadenosine tetraphosphate (Ap4A) HIT family hydrolase